MKCCSCKKYIKKEEEQTIWFCELCGGEHHPECSGDNCDGHSENKDEDAYSICKKCINKQ